jgi:SAM-dependent methyltransferase
MIDALPTGPTTPSGSAETDAELQRRNQEWWQANPMIYDNFRGGLPIRARTREWYEEIDRRFFNDWASWFAQAPGERPFSALIPFDELRGKRVLEIGCGSGAHARLLAEAGCQLTCVDITPGGVEMTRERLRVYGLEAEVLQMDAERLAFPDDSFDFVWSWGVIHHSANTASVVRQIARVLRPGGETRLMVYHRRSFFALYVLLAGIATGRVFRQGFQQVVNHYADGALARLYTRREFADLLSAHLGNVTTAVLGQKNEMIPLPGAGGLAEKKIAVARHIPDPVASAFLRRWGNFIWATARKM